MQRNINFSINGYTTYLPASHSEDENIRIICLVKDHLGLEIKLDDEIMKSGLPTIWVNLILFTQSPSV